MNISFIEKLFTHHQKTPKCPTPKQVEAFFENLIGLLFPDLMERTFDTVDDLSLEISNLKTELYEMLFRYPNRESIGTENKSNQFFSKLEAIHSLLESDVQATYLGDPAAKSIHEVIRSYPGFYAIAAYRFAHELYKLDIQVIPRMIAEIAHSKTGIDIHPGAHIGKGFCIDHGTGLVIGETTKIGNYVKIYQGVTLGALSVSKELANLKRHPTIEDHVVIYANSTILGGETIIGQGSIIGGNNWITKSVPRDSKIYFQN